jgi:formate hydrogenlyase subunit 4
MSAAGFVPPLLGLVFAPLLLGLVTRTKALFAGRRGAPLLQPYHDLMRLLKKGAVYSTTTTWAFRATPVVAAAAAIAALLVLPLGSFPALLAFEGDFVLFAALFGAARFFTIVGAFDTGSSFPALGASREATFAALTEPALFLALAVLTYVTGNLSLSTMLDAITGREWRQAGPALVLVAAALFAVLLAECSRIPIDDPTTHLELTMIHEVMVLDHGGPDLAFVLYGGALKLWALGALVAGLLVPVRTGQAVLDGIAFLGGMIGVAVVLGVVESSMARLRLHRVPQLLVGASAFAVLALLLALR